MRRTGRKGLGVSAGFAVTLALALSGGSLAAQQARQDTTARPDSTALRLQERLKLLNLPLGDSSQAFPSDSVPEGQTLEIFQDSTQGEPDDVVAALKRLPGYSAAEYQGTGAEYLADEGILYLHGDTAQKAGFQQGGNQLQADSLIKYKESESTVNAFGSPVLIPVQGDRVRSEALFWNLDRQQGAALQAETQYSAGANWLVKGDLPLIRSDLAYGHSTIFTSCDLDVPHYHFETDELKIVKGNVLVARPVRLYFGDVPVAWLPFIAQSLARGRASGILTPQFSVNDIVRTSSGYQRRISNVGFYWAMSDYSDAIIALDWFENNYTALTGNVSYNWLRQFLQGSLSFRNYWPVEGGRQFTLNTRHSWEISERTRLTLNGRYASSSSFVTRNSFNPQELTRSIDSDGGFSHRFDWGTLNVSGNRKQYLTDDRVEMTLPDVSLSLKTVSLFKAPQARARWFNNMTWSGGGNVRRSIRDYAPDGDQYDKADLSANANSSVSVGNLSLGGGLSYRDATVRDYPLDSLPFFPDMVAERGIQAFQTLAGRQATADVTGDRVDYSQASLEWNSNISYQQNLIGSTTLTPRVTLSGMAQRADTVQLAQSFVSGPTRIAFGATLRSDLYGFFPGFAGFERLRHKFSPSFSYDWSPEVTPTDLQKAVFGSRSLQPTKVLSVTLNQTFEAKKKVEGDTTGVASDSTGTAVDSTGAGGFQVGEDGLRRRETGEVVTLLGLSTSAISYNFVEADSTGSFLKGFSTTTLSNTITSDYLQGLQIRMTHELFDDQVVEGEGGVTTTRKFSPHLSQLNLGFSLSNRSSIFRWLGLAGSRNASAQQQAPADSVARPGEEEDLLGGLDDPASMIPGTTSRRPRSSRGSAGIGEWSANLSYALNRPRSGVGVSQMLQVNLRLQPTEHWEMTWRTGYDLENHQFSDHVIRLTRDLHRWQADFDFLQTPTGNWAFRFNVTLLDNQDLKFDYQQRNVDRSSSARQPPF